jgi:hypothetical protein
MTSMAKNAVKRHNKAAEKLRDVIEGLEEPLAKAVHWARQLDLLKNADRQETMMLIEGCVSHLGLPQREVLLQLIWELQEADAKAA